MVIKYLFIIIKFFKNKNYDFIYYILEVWLSSTPMVIAGILNIIAKTFNVIASISITKTGAPRVAVLLQIQLNI